MQTTATVQIIALAAAIIMLLGGGFIVYRRSTGWGPATLSAFGLVLLVPTILILAVTNALSKEILATLLGGVAGYIFGRASSGDGPDRPR
ncbi:MAG: hypothetical protein ACLQF1_20455 [Methyloceanibacter sp.]|jgi:uncharacterized membrane protein YjjP (DUF1212 family)